MWPEECTEVVYNSTYLYLDVKPMPEGRMDIGLYTDQLCTTEYNGKFSVEEVLDYYQSYYKNDGENNDESSYSSDETTYSLKEKIDIWNDYLETFKYCHPCKAYDLSQTSPNYEDQEEGDDNRGLFRCEDDADYVNVNQCMKFRTKADSEAVSFTDVMAGFEQGTLTSIHAGGQTYGNVMGGKKRIALHVFGWIVFLLGSCMLYRATVNSTRQIASIMSPDAQAPLIGKGEVA